MFSIEIQEECKDALADMIIAVQDGDLLQTMMLYSSVGKYLAFAVGVPHRWVISLALEEV